MGNAANGTPIIHNNDAPVPVAPKDPLTIRIVPADDHVRPSSSAQNEAPCNMDTTLLNTVYDYFLNLVGRMPHAAIFDNFCARQGNAHEQFSKRILMTFSRCSNISMFIFDLTENADIKYWLRLSDAAMVCSIHPCRSGFVFVDWIFWDPGGVSNMKREAHATCMYFNLDTEQQYFIDPSSVCFITPKNTLDRSLFIVHSFWRKQDISQTLPISVVDVDIHDNLQSYFAAPWNKNSNESTQMDQRFCNTEGCCTTVTILIVAMCLRFGCKDPQLMVNIIRCIMHHLRTTLTRGDFIRFLLQVRQWQNHMAVPDILHPEEKLTPEQFRYWLGITSEPDKQRCNYMQNDGSLCQRPCDGGTVWCSEHRQRIVPSVGDSFADVDQRLDANLVPIPNIIRYSQLWVNGYFPASWKQSGWQCSMEVLWHQMRVFKWKSVQQPSIKNGPLLALQFMHFDSLRALDSLLSGPLTRYQTLLLELPILLVQFVAPSNAGDMVDRILRFLPVRRWPVAYLMTNRNTLLYLLIQVAHPEELTRCLTSFRMDTTHRDVYVQHKRLCCGHKLRCTFAHWGMLRGFTRSSFGRAGFASTCITHNCRRRTQLSLS